MVSPDYRKRGIAEKLLEDAYLYLGTTKPIITIPEFSIPEFDRIIEEYGWIKTGETGIYQSNEIIFNSGGDVNGSNIKKLQPINSTISR